MCLGHWYTPGTKDLRMVRVVILWNRRVVNRQQETTKLKILVLDVIREDRRLPVYEVDDVLRIGKSSVQRILSDLSMTIVFAR